METDGYSEFFSEEKLNQAVRETLRHMVQHPEENVSEHIRKTLHEIFCPCLLPYCPSCQKGNDESMSSFETNLIEEVNTRLLRGVCGNNCAHARKYAAMPKKSLPIVFRLSQKCCAVKGQAVA